MHHILWSDYIIDVITMFLLYVELYIYLKYLQLLTHSARVTTFNSSFANKVYPDQTAPAGAVWSGFTSFAYA